MIVIADLCFVPLGTGMRIFMGDVVCDFIRFVCYLFAAGRLSCHIYFFAQNWLRFLTKMDQALFCLDNWTENSRDPVFFALPFWPKLNPTSNIAL
jgi:hypothetical protein